MTCRLPNPLLLAALLASLALLAAGCAEPMPQPSRTNAVPDTGVAAQSAADSATFAAQYAGPIEEAHSADFYRRQGALAAKLKLHFGGQERLKGNLLMTPSTGQTRLDLGGDTVAVFDGTDAWVAPDAAAMPRARFDLLTWPYFLAAPYKLRDPGTRLEDRGTMMLDGKPYDAARLTFAPGTGDSPDDWYLLYRDPDTGRLHAMAYIVTYGGTSAREAEQSPHAIVYDDYRTVEGVPVPTTWRFYNWSEDGGLEGNPIGEMDLDNPRFVEPEPDDFARPEGGGRAPAPPPS